MERIKIYNGKIITPYRLISNGTIIVEDSKIISITEGNIDTQASLEIDACGNYISPGFIDLHVHGGGGADFMDGDVDSFLQVANTHAQYGTTAMSPTTLTSEASDLITTFENYEKALKLNTKGAQFLGIHLEGPYFAMNQRGAQDPRYIRNPDPEEYLEILSSYSHLISRWSSAPELPGTTAFAKALAQYNVLPAIAHSDAVYEDVVKAFENGFSLVTHLYSGMSGVTRRNAHRYAGVIESAFIIDEMDVEVIADGVHLPAPFLQLIYKIKGAEHIALVTDAMRGAGMGEGKSVLGGIKNGLDVIIEEGVAKLPDKSSFAGSVATADRLIRSMTRLGQVPLQEAIKMMTATPARILGIDKTKGSLAEGKDADIIIFDDNITIQKTIIKGNIAFER